MAVVGIAWAVAAPIFVVVREVRDEQYRQLVTVAVLLRETSLKNPPTDFMLNGTNYAGQISRVAEAEATRSARCNRIVAISSGFILFLSFCTFKSAQKHQKGVAEQG